MRSVSPAKIRNGAREYKGNKAPVNDQGKKGAKSKQEARAKPRSGAKSSEKTWQKLVAFPGIILAPPSSITAPANMTQRPPRGDLRNKHVSSTASSGHTVTTKVINKRPSRARRKPPRKLSRAVSTRSHPSIRTSGPRRTRTATNQKYRTNQAKKAIHAAPRKSVPKH